MKKDNDEETEQNFYIFTRTMIEEWERYDTLRRIKRCLYETIVGPIGRDDYRADHCLV